MYISLEKSILSSPPISSQMTVTKLTRKEATESKQKQQTIDIDPQEIKIWSNQMLDVRYTPKKERHKICHHSPNLPLSPFSFLFFLHCPRITSLNIHRMIDGDSQEEHSRG